MHYFIVNPNACSGKGIKIWERLEKKLQQAQTAYEVFFTEGPGHATRIADMLCAKYGTHTEDTHCRDHFSHTEEVHRRDRFSRTEDTHCRDRSSHTEGAAGMIASERTEDTGSASCTIVAVGGDGTANEVISGLHDYADIHFGYIPTGSGNDLARGLSLPTEPVAALFAILHPSRVRRIRLGCVHTNGKDCRFAVSTGIGFDAAVCHETFRSRIKPVLNRFGLGKLTYLGIALKQLLLLRPFPVTMILDDGVPVKFPAVYFAAFMNLKYEGGGFMFCPNATAEDDLLDICLVEKMPKLKILFLLPTAFRGKHVRYKGIHILRCQKAQLRANAPQAIHTDGEAAAVSSSMKVSLSKEKLPFIVG